MLGFGGVMQGITLENRDPQVTIVNASIKSRSPSTSPPRCASASIAIGNGIFALHLGWMLLDWLRLPRPGQRLAAEILLEPYEGRRARRSRLREEVAA